MASKDLGPCDASLSASLFSRVAQQQDVLTHQIQRATDRTKSGMYKLYSMQRSGNSCKVRLALALLNAPYRAIEIDILRGESRTPDFLSTNPSSQMPLADIALYGYTHVADHCDYDLATFPAIRAWLRRIEQTPGFVSMDWRPCAEVDDPAGVAAEA